MPGPYCSVQDVMDQTLARLGQAPSTTLPIHWDAMAIAARDRGYQRLIGILAGRGYSLAAIGSWTGRASYNLDYSTAYAFGYGNFRRGEDDNNSEQKELARLDKELSSPSFLLIGDDGSVMEPDLVVGGGQVTFGRMKAFDYDGWAFEQWEAGVVTPDDWNRRMPTYPGS